MVDVWAVGVLLYQKITGKNPFYDKNEEMMHLKILTMELQFKGLNISNMCKRFIKGLLCRDPLKRLTVKKALKHKWFYVRLNPLLLIFRWRDYKR